MKISARITASKSPMISSMLLAAGVGGLSISLVCAPRHPSRVRPLWLRNACTVIIKHRQDQLVGKQLADNSYYQLGARDSPDARRGFEIIRLLGCLVDIEMDLKVHLAPPLVFRPARHKRRKDA